MKRLCILGDHHNSAGGNAAWAAQFANIVKEKDITVDYVGDKNFEKDHKLYPISVKSNINSEVVYNNLKTPADVLTKMYFAQQRLYEQLKTKIYDAYIVQRFDFLPILHSFNLTENTPVYIPMHDISAFEAIITPTASTTEAPYRLVELMRHLLTSNTGLNIISSSDFLSGTIKNFNPNHNIQTLPIPLNEKIQNADVRNFDQTEGVLWVGNQTAYKNPAMMLEIVKAMPNMKFTMIFNTKNKGTFTKISKKYKAPNLTILPAQTIEQLIELYQSHRLGIITSAVETFCIVAQEQQLFHPTLVWNKSCNEYHKIWPELVEFKDIRDAIQQIKTLYQDRNTYSAKIKKAKQDIVKNYSMDNVKQLYFNFIDLLEADLKRKNPFKNLNNIGSMIQSRIGLLDEISYEDVLADLKYADYTLGQLGILSQLSQFERKEYRTKTVFTKMKE